MIYLQMRCNTLHILTIVLLHVAITQCETVEKQQCDTSGSDDKDACNIHDTINQDVEESIEHSKEQDETQQPTWIASVYDYIVSTLNSVTDRLVEGPSKTNNQNIVKDPTEMSIEEILNAAKLMSANIGGIDAKLFDTIIDKVVFGEEKTIPGTGKDVYEYPPVNRIKPGKIGEVKYVELADGVEIRMTTRAINPPVFEIPDFLSNEECDYIIEKATVKGLNESIMFVSKTDMESGNQYGVHRVSYSSYLKINDTGKEFISKLHDKVSKLTGMPNRIVQWSESLTIGMYKPGGHYHAHLDSNEASRKTPCCFQKECVNSEGNTETTDCCRLCRYATVLYYLNDVEEGGETAFPFADNSIQTISIKGDTPWQNLTSHCYDAALTIKPEKGKAVMWYNHFVDKNGYISFVDKRSYHGGCEVVKGTKWIATNWMSTPIYPHRFIPSKYRDVI